MPARCRVWRDSIPVTCPALAREPWTRTRANVPCSVSPPDPTSLADPAHLHLLSALLFSGDAGPGGCLHLRLRRRDLEGRHGAPQHCLACPCSGACVCVLQLCVLCVCVFVSVCMYVCVCVYVCVRVHIAHSRTHIAHSRTGDRRRSGDPREAARGGQEVLLCHQ